MVPQKMSAEHQGVLKFAKFIKWQLILKLLFLSCSLTGTKCTNSFLITQKQSPWQSLFCVQIHTPFRPPFGIGALHKYFNSIICFVLFYNIQNEIHETKWLHLQFTSYSEKPLICYWGVGGDNYQTVKITQSHFKPFCCSTLFHSRVVVSVFQ